MLAALALVVLGAPGIAGATHSAATLVSTGPSGGNGPFYAHLVGSSSDGTRAIFETAEPLVSEDTDSAVDVYERAGTTTTLLSTGPAGGNGPDPANFAGASRDATHVFFQTTEVLVPEDTDSSLDVYERAGGVTTLVSIGADGGNGGYDAYLYAVSDDGMHAFLNPRESLDAADTDGTYDVYDRSGGGTALISSGPAGGNGSSAAQYAGSSADGSKVFFQTTEQLVPEDTDSSQDVYERANGTTTLISQGPNGGNADIHANFEAVSADGNRVVFSTTESLVPEDTDVAKDVYQNNNGTTSVLTIGPFGGNGSFPADYVGESTDGSHVFFDTAERLISDDRGSANDVYDNNNGTLSYISNGTPPFDREANAYFVGASTDGTHVFVRTDRSLLPSDTDGVQDIYERFNNTTTQISTGANGGNATMDAYFGGASADGSRVFFQTRESLLSSDTDGTMDVYERYQGSTYRISTGAAGGNGNYNATYEGDSEDGGRVFFRTAEPLASDDTDTSDDVYVARVNTGFPRPKGATPLRVALTVAFKPCTNPNSMHGPPALGGGVADPSCSPPVQTSNYLTVGSPDANGQAARAGGVVKVDVIAGDSSTAADEADTRLVARMSDVRNMGSLTDYTGELELRMPIRITDKNNGSYPVDPGTAQDVSFSIAVPCVATDGPEGGFCEVITSADSVLPGTVVESRRTLWDVGSVEVYDGGADGLAATGDNTLFLRQGLFIP